MRGAIIIILVIIFAILIMLFLNTKMSMPAQSIDQEALYHPDTLRDTVYFTSVEHSRVITKDSINRIKNEVSIVSNLGIDQRAKFERTKAMADRYNNLYKDNAIGEAELASARRQLLEAQKTYEATKKLRDSTNEIYIKAQKDFLKQQNLKVDTIVTTTIKKSAKLGYTYPITLFRGKPGNINVFVTISDTGMFVKDTLQKISKEQNQYRSGNDTVVVYPNNIFIYKYLAVSLIDPNGEFKITQVHDSNTQEIDTAVGNSWRWTISTNTIQPSSDLILKVTAIKPNSVTSQFQSRDISIRVIIDNENIWRRIWIFITDNLEWTLGGIAAVLVAVFGFYAKRSYDKKDKKKAEQEKSKPVKRY